jgi:hypothetical protein
MQYDLGTVTGVIALTTFVVSMLKGALKNAPIVRRLPMIVISLIVSILVCLLARSAGYLHGPWTTLVAQTLLAALGSGGLYNVWTGSAIQSLENAAKIDTTLGVNALSLDDTKSFIQQEMQTARERRQQSGDYMRLVWLVCLIPFMGGCGGNAELRAYQAKVGYANTLETLRDLRDWGIISQAQVDATKPARVAARLALDSWEQAARAKQDTSTWEQKFISARDVVQRLIDSQSPAATRPTTRKRGRHGRRDRRGRPGRSQAHLGAGRHRIEGRSRHYSGGMGRCEPANRAS